MPEVKTTIRIQCRSKCFPLKPREKSNICVNSSNLPQVSPTRSNPPLPFLHTLQCLPALWPSPRPPGTAPLPAWCAVGHTWWWLQNNRTNVILLWNDHFRIKCSFTEFQWTYHPKDPRCELACRPWRFSPPLCHGRSRAESTKVEERVYKLQSVTCYVNRAV